VTRIEGSHFSLAAEYDFGHHRVEVWECFTRVVVNRGSTTPTYCVSEVLASVDPIGRDIREGAAAAAYPLEIRLPRRRRCPTDGAISRGP